MKLGGGFGGGLMQGASFAKNLFGAYKMGQDMEQQSELGEVAKAKAAESTGFTAGQGQELEGLAKQGFDNITFDDKTNAYVAKNAAGDAKTVAMGGVTDFLGERTAGSLSRQDQDGARALAMADVVGRSDPERGQQMRQRVQEGQHAAKRQGREEKKWASEDDVERIDTELGAKFKAFLTGPDGQPRQATADDFLANAQQRAFALAEGGHMKAADQAMKDHMAQAHIKIQMEGAQRKEAAGKAAAAIGAGDYSVAADFYNRYVPSGSKVTGIEPGKDGQLVMQRVGPDGQPMAPTVFKNQGQALSMLKSLDDPMALYQYSQGEFKNQLLLRGESRADNADRRADRADGRAAAADGRAAASHAGTMADRRELRDVREALARETDPSMTPTQLRAVRAGVLQTPGADKGGKYDYDPARVQKSFGETVADPITGKETVKRNPAEEKKFLEFMADNPGIRDVDEGLVRYNRSRVQGERKAQAETSQRREKTSAQMTDANLVATAKKYNMTVAQVVEELAKQGVRR